MRKLQTANDWKQPCPECNHSLLNHTKGYCDVRVVGLIPGDLYACGCRALKSERLTIYHLND